MKISTYKSSTPNMMGEHLGQIDVGDTQIHLISNTKKERNAFFSLLKKVLRTDEYSKVTHITYWTIQHNYPKLTDFNKSKWFFSSYDNIASPACSLSIPKEDGRFTWVYGTHYGAHTLKQAKIGLQRIIEASKNDKSDKHAIFRIVKVTHFFDIVEIV